MSALTKLTLLAVVFVDLLGQGLVLPIISILLVDPSAGFLPASTSAAERELSYGLVVGCFFLFWFLGVAYVARLSDVIGRKNAMQLCLLGALAGYALTIVALATQSLWLLILGRAITGFTAGNQPIAQAAMIDLSRNDDERTRNMGYIVAGVAAGLVAGPIIGGLLSDPAILGGWASFALPFYAALAIVAITMVMVAVFFHDARGERQRFVFRPFEFATLLIEVFRRPLVLRVSAVFACLMVATNSTFIFMDNYLAGRFAIGLFGSSLAMLVVGGALALSSTLLVGPAVQRFGKLPVVASGLAMLCLGALAFVTVDAPVLAYVAVFVAFLFFGLAYPVMLGLFSACVGPDEQGWVMGISAAQFTLVSGIISFVGGDLMGIDLRLPFFVASGAALLGLLAMATLWRSAAFRQAVLASSAGTAP